MGRRATGTLVRLRGRLYCRLSVAGQRRAFALPELGPEAAEARRAVLADLAARVARLPRDIAEGLVERAASAETEPRLRAVLGAAEQVLAGGIVVLSLGPEATWGEVADRWIAGDLARAYPDHVRPLRRTATVRSYLERYLRPAIGHVPVRAFTLDHALAAAAALPAVLRATTRAVVLSVVNRVLSLAVFPLRLIATNPIPRGFRPKGQRRVRPFLYPAEEARLLGSSSVELEWRLAYGVLAREGLRYDEARRLDVGDFDASYGTIRCDVNKTDDPRTWALGADVARALRESLARREAALGRALRTDEPLLTSAGGQRLYRPRADRFRERMAAAGLERPELYASTPERGPLRVHDLRATFVTLALAAGRTETWVADRTGHKSSEMIARYRRAARTAAELHLGWLAPLDQALPELRSIGSDSGSTYGEGGGNLGAQPPSGFSSTQEESARDHADSPRTPPPNPAQEPACPPVLPIRAAGAADSPRADLARELAGRVANLAASGDLAAARVAYRALGELLGEDAAVADLAAERKRRRK